MLQQRAMLASVSVKRWSTNVHDTKVSKEVDIAHNASNAGRYTKALVDKAHVKALSTSAGNIRAFHYAHTLSWDDNGDRILPAAAFQKYTDGLSLLKQEDEKVRREFFKLYPALVAAAPARLGTLFDARDFPAPADLPSKFDVKINIKPVPDAKDFRVDVSAEAIEEIRASIVADEQTKLQGAMKECYTMVHEVVEHISTTLKKEDPRIFETLVTNATDLVDRLEFLNITGDPVLEQFRKDLGGMLPKSAKAFKHNPELRAQVADEADTLLAKMKGYV